MKQIISLLKSFLIVLILVITLSITIISCNQPDTSTNGQTVKDTSGANADSNENSMSLDSSKTQSDSTAKLTGGLIDLRTAYTNFTKRYGLPKFHKLKIIPYQRDASDDVRLWVYAMKSDLETDIIGTPFVISKDGTGEDPASLPHAVKWTALVLLKAEAIKIYRASPVSVNYLDLKPIIETDATAKKDAVLTYASFQILKNGADTKAILKPSPPYFTLTSNVQIKK